MALHEQVRDAARELLDAMNEVSHARAGWEKEDAQWSVRDAMEKLNQAIYTYDEQDEASKAQAQQLAEAQATIQQLTRANEIVLDSREQLLNTFCIWQQEYQDGKMAKRRLPEMEATIQRLTEERDEWKRACSDSQDELFKAMAEVRRLMEELGEAKRAQSNACEECPQLMDIRANLYGHQIENGELTQRVAALEGALKLYKEASYQSHTGHWDRTGGGGRGCPECLRAGELRSQAEKILAPVGTEVADKHREMVQRVVELMEGALKKIAAYGVAQYGEEPRDGLCPHGCDCPHIAEQALASVADVPTAVDKAWQRFQAAMNEPDAGQEG